MLPLNAIVIISGKKVWPWDQFGTITSVSGCCILLDKEFEGFCVVINIRKREQYVWKYLIFKIPVASFVFAFAISLKFLQQIHAHVQIFWM